MKRIEKQAGAELCQAQAKLNYADYVSSVRLAELYWMSMSAYKLQNKLSQVGGWIS